MGYLETTQHSQEIHTWAMMYQFEYPAAYDALQAAHPTDYAQRAAERFYIQSNQGQRPQWGVSPYLELFTVDAHGVYHFTAR